jgi:malate permease and related proteins
MHIFIIVLQSVLALLGVGVIGFWITQRHIVPENALGFLSRLAIDIALPCMVFSSTVLNFSPDKFPNWWQLPIWYFGFTAVSLALTVISSFMSKKETRGEFALNIFFQNGLFMPLILISGIFGADSPYIPQLYIYIIFHPVIFFSCYHLFFRHTSRQKIQLNRVLNPILIATLLAVVFRLLKFNQYLPDFANTILRMVGAMALPLTMIILGGSLYLDFKQKGKIYYGEILKFLVIKNIAFPLVFLGLIIFFKPEYSIALLFILQSAIPPITGTPIMTERAGGNKSISNQFVLSSFVFSAVSVPLVFLAFNHFFPAP